ncbi:MAG: hypothetical protein J6T31_05080, partial [Methanobrevibacter sp.]|nr:hypothetical protein [Methanobrevibacter sp.]
MKINKITLLMAIMIISILAIGAVSAESIDDATISADDSDLSVATVDSEISDVSAVADDAVVDDVVGDDSLGEPKTIDINDDTYSTYFDENGMLDTVSDHDTLVVGTLTEKDLKVNKSVTITGNSEGVINNGTITLVDYNAGGTTVSGLTFNNFNKDAIVIADGIDNVKIEENQITVNTGEEPSIAAVTIVGYSKNITILNNKIDMTGDAENLYGICAIAYFNKHYSEANSVVDIKNNNITVTGSNMVEAMYLTNIENSVIDNNIVVVSCSGSSDAYGIQIADMSYWASMETFEPSPFRPPNNINITNNQFTVKGKNMVYGVTVISIAMMDSDSPTAISYPESEIIISNNIVDAESAGGVVAIGGQTLTQSKITDNNITAIGGSTDGITTVDSFGVHNVAILLIDDTSSSYASGKECENVEITGNLFFDSAITSIQVETPESATVENNLVISENGAIIVNDDTYQYLFDEEGNFVYETEDGTTILVDVLTNKNMIFSQPLNIKSKDDSSVITNGTITLTADASGSSVT